ncbi:MAG TPA: YkvA family protein [Longimicrobiales bacterium]|nr:YkvA family protein [Longimicrobiales bacterium]
MKRVTIGRRKRGKARPGRNLARALMRELPSLFRLVFRLMRDPAVPRFDKLLFAAVAVYMVTPLDLVPDVLGPMGWIDDFYLLGLALGRLVTGAGPDRLLRHWDGDPHTLGFLVEGVEDLGDSLPDRIQRGLRGIVRNPRQLRPKKKRPVVRRIRVDRDSRVHLEE